MAGAVESERNHGAVDTLWWLAAPALAAAGAARVGAPLHAAVYQFGDARLQIAADDPALLATFEQMYGDCAGTARRAPDGPTLRCTVRRLGDPPLVLLTFEHGAPPDAAATALNLLHPPPGAPQFTVRDSPLPGWRLAGGAQPVLAASGPHVLIDPNLVLSDFLIEYLVSTALAAQPELLAVHGASVQIGAAGVLVAGRSHMGKSTTSLTLAARGHTFLGDDVALLRLATNELVPFRRSLNLRAGPQAPEVLVALGRIAQRDEGAPGRGWGRPLRSSELFPGQAPGPAPLTAAFFLNGFADRPAAAPVRLTLHDVDVFDNLVTELGYASWGLVPERRALRMLALKRALTRIPCWLLTAGTPAATAALIEHTLEERC